MSQREKVVFARGTKIDEWRVVKHVGHGGYGEIYQVMRTDETGPYAMKVEMKSANKKGLLKEVQCLRQLQGSPYFPRLITEGERQELRYFVMELLGPSVSMVRRELRDQRYTRQTITVVAKAMLKCIEELHKRGYLHQDIKPGNFLYRNDQDHMICLIDFGLSRCYVDSAGKHLPESPNAGFTGTYSYASLRAHEEKSLGRRDDIVSWFYTIVEAVERRLPWPGSKNKEQTHEFKKLYTIDQLCQSLPHQFITIMKKNMTLSYDDKPDYNEYYRLLDAAIEEQNCRNIPFDWERLPSNALAQLSDIKLPSNPGGPGDVSSSDSSEEEEEEEEKADTPPPPRNTGNMQRRPPQYDAHEEVGCKCNVA